MAKLRNYDRSLKKFATVRTPNSRQKRPKLASGGYFSVGNEKACRVLGVWNSTTKCLRFAKNSYQYVYIPYLFFDPIFFIPNYMGSTPHFFKRWGRGKASKRLFHIYLTAPGIKETKSERFFCCKHRKWRSSSTIGEQPFISTNDAMLCLFYLNSSQKHFRFTIS